jgi:hypothetical protein
MSARSAQVAGAMAAIGLKEGDTIALMLRNEPALMDVSWLRVMSPAPGPSTLITSAPMNARSCVQVGRVHTPSSALPVCPQGFADGGDRPLAAADPAARLFAGFLRALDFDFLRVAIRF